MLSWSKNTIPVIARPDSSAWRAREMSLQYLVFLRCVASTKNNFLETSVRYRYAASVSRRAEMRERRGEDEDEERRALQL